MDSVPHFHLQSVGSTLTEAWEMATKGEQVPFWLTAEEQTQGRGRFERNWVSKPGNLYSTLTIPVSAPDQLPLLPFAVALGVSSAIIDVLPAASAPAVTHKWPNDVLIEGAKTSGILIEHRKVSRRAVIAIGMGINVAHAPDLADKPTTCLARHGSTAGPMDLFIHLRHRLFASIDMLQNTPESIVPDWLSRARGLGEPVTVQDGQTKLEGTFDHLAADGALMVRLPSGAMRAIRTGDVVIKPR